MAKLKENRSGLWVTAWNYDVSIAPDLDGVAGKGVINTVRPNAMTFDAEMCAAGNIKEILAQITVDELAALRQPNCTPCRFFIVEHDPAQRRSLVEALNAHHKERTRVDRDAPPARSRVGMVESLREFGWSDKTLVDLMIAGERKRRRS
jgi:hypothetical protein